jgi:hypothetical protein
MMLDEYGPAKSHIRKSYFSFLAELIIKGPLGEETWHLHGVAEAAGSEAAVSR